MINLETVKTLRALRLPGMARELESQLEDPQRYKDLSFEDRLALYGRCGRPVPAPEYNHAPHPGSEAQRIHSKRGID